MPAFGAAEPASARPPRLTVADLVVARSDADCAVRHILDHVSFTLEPGDMVALAGPSGAGKTTLLHAVAGLVDANAGAVSWGSLDVCALPERRRDRWRRDNVGLVFQEFQLLAELGVMDNILLPARFDHWSMPQRFVERAKALAERVGLDRRAPRVSVLSRGEQQRVAIARALLRRPRLILADEPTASLDRDSGMRVAELLLACAAEEGAGVVVVSHDAALLERAGRILRLNAGKLEGALP